MYLGGVTTVTEESSTICLRPKQGMDRIQATRWLSTSDQHLLDWWTFWVTTHNLGIGVAFELFQSQADFKKLCPPQGSLWCLWMSHSFHRALSYSTPGPAPAYPTGQHIHVLLHTGLLDNPSLAVDKGFGLCEDHHLFHQELLDHLGNKRTIFSVASGRCRNWYRWQPKLSLLAQRHTVMVTFHLLSLGSTAWSMRFTTSDLTQIYQKWQWTDRAFSLMYLKYISQFSFVHKLKLV